MVGQQSGMQTGEPVTGSEMAGSSGESQAGSERPTGGADRIVSLDFMRGIAVLGILFANITAFGHPFLAYYWPDALPNGGTGSDDLFWLFQFTAVDGKFRGIFTLLFGAGMFLFMERVWERGGSALQQVRRLMLLMGFGALHFLLLFIGDILLLYALSGFVALAFLRWSAKQQFWVGIAWYLAGSLLFTLALTTQTLVEAQPENHAEMGAELSAEWTEIEAGWERKVADADAARDLGMNGSYGDLVVKRFDDFPSHLEDLIFIALFETVPLMLVGMGLFRFGLFSGGIAQSRLKTWGAAGVAAGIVATLWLGWSAYVAGYPPHLTSFAFNGASALTRFPMVLGLMALLAMWAPTASRSWLGQRFVAAGRMAFSNYIGTSILMLFVFQPWAGDQFGILSRAELFVVVVAAWIIMLAWSKPWLEKFRYGPLEWVWRCLTYGKSFPLKR